MRLRKAYSVFWHVPLKGNGTIFIAKFTDCLHEGLEPEATAN